MSRTNRDSPTAGERVAQLAVAQYLLFDATVESLSILTERLVDPRTARELGETRPRALVEPFQSRFALLRRMLDEQTAPTERELEVARAMLAKGSARIARQPAHDSQAQPAKQATRKKTVARKRRA